MADPGGRQPADDRPELHHGPNATNDKGEPIYLPYLRDPETLARAWAIPGTAGLDHRIGGLEKEDKTGNISYDPANHDLMIRTRQAKIDGITVPPLEVDDPDGTAKVLVLGWGSTYGPIGAACRRVRKVGGKIAQAHLRHLNPFPANLGDVLKSYDKVLVPEMNLGQLAMLLRAKYLVDVVSYAQVRGMPLGAAELAEVIGNLVEETEGIDDDARHLGADAAAVTHGEALHEPIISHSANGHLNPEGAR